MGGGHQTRLCPDCARSNPAEGSADFPQARCHFYLNNSYEESNSGPAFVLSFCMAFISPSIIFFVPRFGPFFHLLSWIAVAQNFDVMIGILQNHLTSCGASGRWMFLDYEWRAEDPQGKYS